ncbi:MAG: uroporphyrinogen-III C-methyltransferase [Bryobacterales bacterium]|nr:uroporphyrinogen-III C-methyltransferase [Bryobacterales bacterium]
MATARVYLVGAGPGDPELLTVKAARLVACADVILYDRLVPPAILSLARPGAELVYVGKEDGCAQETQRRIFTELAMNALRGRTVVRLKGGDPMVFGRGAEEWAFLSQLGVAVELVPGISSAVAVPALASIPLTARGVARSFAVATGHAKEGEPQHWEAFAEVDTLVILMGVKHRTSIATTLIAVGRNPLEPCAFIESGSTENEQVVIATLEEVAAGATDVASPAVWVCGQVVALRDQLRGSGAAAQASFEPQNPWLDVPAAHLPGLF